MTSNQLPEDVKRAASILLRNHMLGMELPDDECDDCIDLIAPFIIEWARKDALLRIRIAQLEAREKNFAVRFNERGGVASESFMRAWAATETALRDARAQFPTPDETTGGE